MPPKRQRWVIGNWKMNGSLASIETWVQHFQDIWQKPGLETSLMVCPPLPLLQAFQKAVSLTQLPLHIGAQNCDPDSAPNRTGNVSASMLKDVGCTGVLVGHSERREHHQEQSKQIRQKAEAAIQAGLLPIICVGESENERETAQAFVARQLDLSVPSGQPSCMIAYEPVWAIGTGHVPDQNHIITIHHFIKEHLGYPVPVLYGGSVTPQTVGTLWDPKEMDGFLVGGASLNADDFFQIAQHVSR